MAMRKTKASSNLDSFKQTVGGWVSDILSNDNTDASEIDLKFAEIIAVATFSRRQELMKVLTELVFRQSHDSYLMDYNYNIETTLSSDICSKVNEVMLVLELFLAVNESGSVSGE